VADGLEARVLAEIRRIFATELEREGPIGPEHELLRDLHVDSLDAVVLAVGLENFLRVKLRDDDTADVVTVADLVGRVALRARESA
jgi:acyl carrier protein